jgi:segregation and condensation protein B
MLDDASAQAESVAQRVMEFEGTPDVTDVADTSSDQVSTSTAAIDAPNNNEKTND